MKFLPLKDSEAQNDVPVQASANDDLDAEIEAEIAAQHLHAAEHSYDEFELDSN